MCRMERERGVLGAPTRKIIGCVSGALVGLLLPLGSALAYEDPQDPAVKSGTFIGRTGREIGFSTMGGLLADASNNDWWYGCSPTSAGMMMAYYDRNGYAGVSYANLVPGGQAEGSSYGGGGGLDFDGDVTPDLLCNKAIASSNHIADFWTGYGNSGDDPLASGRTRPDDFDCLADFMGTSQDSCGTSDGGSRIFWNIDGTPWTEADAVAEGVEDEDLTYGIGEYVRYCGYEVKTLYTQVIHAKGCFPNGFDVSQYRAEIDAGRPVLVHIAGHSMYGYGYDDTETDKLYVYDTWDDNDGAGTNTDGQNPGYLTWGECYPPGGAAGHLFCTVFEPLPEPGTIGLLCLAGVALLRRRGSRPPAR